jgi:hypothetical protein
MQKALLDKTPYLSLTWLSGPYGIVVSSTKPFNKKPCLRSLSTTIQTFNADEKSFLLHLFSALAGQALGIINVRMH